ncbi:hypothetical protein V1281_006783 [Nitrobacteraceae bacterium AZCC 2161]
MSDDSLLLFPENIRKQVEIDHQSKFAFVSGPAVREYAESLRDEMTRRRLSFSPIVWPMK